MKTQRFGEGRQALLDLYRKGMPTGASTGWPSLDKHYTVGPAQFTVVTGIPSHGKSEWLDALMCHLIDDIDGPEWRFLVCSPENWPLAVHESKILEKTLGKRFGAGYLNRMTEGDLEACADSLKKRVVFAELEEGESFADMLVTAREFAAAHKNGRTGIVLDPWNQLEHYRPQNLSETEYVSMALSASIRITRETGAHLWIVAHPAKMPKDRGTGERPIPTPYDISGSAHWYNKADNCITIHRDVMAEPGSAAYGMVDVHVQKVRFRHIGRPGIVSLWYDGGAGRYLEQRSEAGYARSLL